MNALTAVPAGALPKPARAARELLNALEGQGNIRSSTRDADRLAYARDMWPRALLWIREGRIPSPPDAVVWPSTVEEVGRVIREARRRKVAVIPFGGGSGVCGGTWALQGGITLDLKRLDSVGKVDAETLQVEAGAGVFGEILERALHAQGFTLGHFPSSIYMSTLGGWLATRSAGQLSSRYGKIEDMVLSLQAVTGTGEPLVTPERPFQGPDVAQWLMGSEGTLCAFTGAKLRVHPAPEHRTFRGVRFPEVAAGLEAMRALMRAGLRPAVARLYDPFDTALVGRHRASERKPPSLRGRWKAEVVPAILRGLAPAPLGHPWLLNRLSGAFRECLLVLMFEGERGRAEAEVRDALAQCVQLGGIDEGTEPAERWYRERYSVSYKMSPLVDQGALADTMEVATTWERVLPLYEAVRKATSPHAFVLCHFSHVYLEGCSLYFSFVTSGLNAATLERRYEALWDAALGAVHEAGASVSHHHGVGVLKARALERELGPGRALLVALKRTFDPDGIMNPGKLSL